MQDGRFTLVWSRVRSHHIKGASKPMQHVMTCAFSVQVMKASGIKYKQV